MKITSKGMTIVEMMVVVTIIGVLVALARPRILGLIVQSRQNEAKQILQGIYTTQAAWRLNFGTYATCLGDMGHRQDNSYYALGFNSGNTDASEISIDQGATSCNDLLGYDAKTGEGSVYLRASGFNGPGLSAVVTVTKAVDATTGKAYATATSFTAGAAGYISSDPGVGAGRGPYDLWFIDDKGFLTHSIKGSPHF